MFSNGLNPKKSLGQNFLMHAQTAQRIVQAAGVTQDSVVLEIGPGTGMLTRELLAKAGKVIAVEADHSLIPELTETFATEIGEGRLMLINQDIRTFEAKSLKSPYILVANIPYYITGEIIRQFLTETHKPRSMTLLVQKEVAVRIARETKESLLSLSVKAFGTPKYCFTVPRGAFRPAPNVDSAVLSVENIRNDAFSSPADEEVFFSILRAGFSQKRKRLAKNLEQLYPAAKIESAFIELALSRDVRAEDIKEEVWRRLTHLLVS
jgi:16S rRNA (adenine1518-N6/adenine1519-N6)-dimethyltransferase